MLLTIEKVAVLRNIPLFADIPSHVLAPVAGIIEEIELEAGKTFIQEGDIEDCLYIIVNGRVRVHSQGQDILTLGPGQSVGELAVLDPEPRSASVSTLEDSFLLRLDKEPFDEIMADRPEIAKGAIHVLCQRVREQGRLAAAKSSAL